MAGNGGAESVFFPILPTEIGKVKLHVTATAQSASDAIEKFLTVEVRLYYNQIEKCPFGAKKTNMFLHP